MLSNAENISRQSKVKENAWNWAKDEVKKSVVEGVASLDDMIDMVKPIVEAYQEHVKTSTLQVVMNKTKNEPEQWMQSRLSGIKSASEELGSPLRELMGMHAVRLKKRATSHEERVTQTKKGKKNN